MPRPVQPDRPALVLVASRRPVLVSGVLREGRARTVEPRGDGLVLAAFPTGAAAVHAALAVQRRLPARVAVHVTEPGAPEPTATCDAVLAASGEGRTVLSAQAVAAVADALPAGTWLRGLGAGDVGPGGRDAPGPMAELLGGPLATGPADRVAGTTHNLPPQLTTFVGRSAEVAQLRGVLGDGRLVTVTGAGGAGKTRLACHVAAQLLDSRPDGVWWADLGDLTDPDAVARTVAAALRVYVEPSADAEATLVAQLRGRRLLLCLDTCEHVVASVARLVTAVLRGCADVTVLATSRELLGVPGERVWPLPPLSDGDAAALFSERAALVGGGGPPGDGDDAAARAICDRLDGMPLAIELAAAWTRVLPRPEIARRLDDQLGLLVGGPRGVADRHRTQAASIAWSHDLLDVADRRLLHGLSVFSGGFTADAAAAVCGPGALEGIRRLVDKSLVVVSTRAAGRYRLLDTVREFAARELPADELTGLRERHLAHLVALAETAEPLLERDQDPWRVALLAERDNLRAALDWGLTRADPGPVRRLAAALARFWFVAGDADGLPYVERALAAVPDDRGRLQARLHAGAGMLAIAAALPVDAQRHSRLAVELAEELDDDFLRGRGYIALAAGRYFGDQEEVGELARTAERYGLACGDPLAIDVGRLVWARSRVHTDRHAEAVAAVRGRAAAARDRGDRAISGFLSGVETWAALLTGDLREAEAIGRAALEFARPLGDPYAMGHMAVNLAWVLGLRGDLDGAHRVVDPIIRASGREVGLLRWHAFLPGKLHLWAGELDEAVRWFTAAIRFGEPDTDTIVAAEALPGLAAALRRSGRADEARAHAERAVELAGTLGVPRVRADGLDQLGFLATTPAAAAELHHQALGLRVAASLWTCAVHSYDALAGCAARAGDPRRAARLLGAADAARERVGMPLTPVERADDAALRERLGAELGADARDAAAAEGAALPRADLLALLDRSRRVRRRAGTGWDGLTRAEHEVVALVAEGLTNPQIAARLFMSRSTVKTHLEHVFAKLAVTSRAELAAVASRRAGPRSTPAG